MRKLLIADDDEQLCTQLPQLLKPAFDVYICKDADVLLDWLRNDPPDILILNLMMAGTDGLGLLQTMKRIGIWPQILPLTVFESPYVNHALQQLQISYLMKKPCRPQQIAARVHDLLCQAQGMPSKDILRNEIQQMLLRLGIRVYSSGGMCLQEAMLIHYQKPGLSMMKELYPAVAQACGGSEERVERAIRECIQRGWKDRDESFWRLYFPVGRDGKVRHPSNSEFLQIMTAYLHQSHRENAINF